MVVQSSLDLSQVQQPLAHNTQCCCASCSKEMVSTDRYCRAVFKFCVLHFFGVIFQFSQLSLYHPWLDAGHL